MARISHKIAAHAHAIVIKDVRENDYDYVAISQDDQTVIISREQLPALIRQLWRVAAK